MNQSETLRRAIEAFHKWWKPEFGFKDKLRFAFISAYQRATIDLMEEKER